jgi:hypothetical protein
MSDDTHSASVKQDAKGVIQVDPVIASLRAAGLHMFMY